MNNANARIAIIMDCSITLAVLAAQDGFNVIRISQHNI